MRTTSLAFLIALGAFAVSSFGQDNRPVVAGGSEQQWMSILQIHAKLEAAGYRNIEQIKREYGNYEVKATDRNGERVKLYLHPQTGEIVNQRQRGSRRDKYDVRESSTNQPNPPDCNKRRCRDDLPKPAVAMPPTTQ